MPKFESNDYFDDWKDLKESTHQKAEEVKKEQDNRNVTKTYVTGEINEYAKEDAKREASDISAIYKKIEDISVSGGVDLSPYLKIADAENVYAKKTDIPDVTDFATKEELSSVENKIPSVDGFVSEEELTSATQDKATIAQVAQIDQKVNVKADSSVVYTKEEADSLFATQNSLETYAKKSDIPSIDGLATKEELNEVENKIPSVDGFVSEADLTSALQDKATIAQVAQVDQKVNTKVDSSVVYTKEESNSLFATQDSLEIYAKKSDIPSVDGFVNEEELTSALQDKATIEQVAQVEQKVNVKADSSVVYTKEEADSLFATQSSLESYAKKSDIPSVDGFVSEEELTSAIQDKATIAQVAQVEQKVDNIDLEPYAKIVDVSSGLDVKANTEDVENALSEKADVNAVVSKNDYAALVAKTEYLEQLIKEYLPGAEEEIIADGEISDLSPTNKSVNIDTPMKSVVIPEASTSYTVQVPLQNESTIELTSKANLYLYNTNSDEISTSIVGPTTEATSNPTIYLSGNYDTLTLENISIAKPSTTSGYNPASIQNVVVTETNTKPVSIVGDFNDGATITNNSSCNLTINNAASIESSVTVVAPNSTVTLSGGHFDILESTVGEDTLYINSVAHIKRLIVNKGNVIVKNYSVNACVDEIVNETPYTVTPLTYEVYTKNDWLKIQNTAAYYIVQEDILNANRCGTGIFGNSAKINLNNHTVRCIENEGYSLLARGTFHYIFENGTLESLSGYGIWASGTGTIELNNVNVKVGGAHALYIAQSGSQIITSGKCRFEVTSEDKRYVANYLDSVWESGWRGFHFGEGTEFVDFDPSQSMSEPGGPVNLLDPGYHIEHTTEIIDETEHDIYTVVKDN